MRLIHTSPFAVVAAQRTRLLWAIDAASPLPRLRLLLLLMLTKHYNALSLCFPGP